MGSFTRLSGKIKSFILPTAAQMTNKSKTLIDLNTSDEKTLISELRISSRLAKRILALRPYQSVDQLSHVWGIEPKILARIRTLVMVQSAETNLPPEKETSHPANINEGESLSAEAVDLPGQITK